MEIMNYEKFCEQYSERLKNLRKRIGVSIFETENIIFGKKHSVSSLERNKSMYAFRALYIEYIYRAVLDEADFSGRNPSHIFKELDLSD